MSTDAAGAIVVGASLLVILASIGFMLGLMIHFRRGIKASQLEIERYKARAYAMLAERIGRHGARSAD